MMAKKYKYLKMEIGPFNKKKASISDIDTFWGRLRDI